MTLHIPSHKDFFKAISDLYELSENFSLSPCGLISFLVLKSCRELRPILGLKASMGMEGVGVVVIHFVTNATKRKYVLLKSGR